MRIFVLHLTCAVNGMMMHSAILSRGLVCIKRSGSDPEKVINNHDVLYKYRQKIFLIREWVENNVSR